MVGTDPVLADSAVTLGTEDAGGYNSHAHISITKDGTMRLIVVFALLVVLMVTGLIVFLPPIPREPPKIIPFNGRPTKMDGPIQYVYAASLSGERWFRLVDSSRAKIKEMWPAQLNADTLIQIINEDDTIMFLKNDEAAKRIHNQMLRTD